MGSTFVAISQKDLQGIPIPVPPTEEQKSIVAKVNELMALCDKLEAQQQKRETLCKLTRTTALDALANAQTPDELYQAWQRVRDNTQLLVGDVESIAELKNTIRRLSVIGFLSVKTSQPVEIDKIRSACDKLKKEYIRKKLIRSQNSIPSIQVQHDYFPIHWVVEAFDRIAVVIGGVTKGRVLRNKKTVNYPYLRVANVQRGYFDMGEMKEIEIPAEEFEKYQLLEGDLLTTEGGDLDKVGRTAIWRGEIEDCIHQNHVFKPRVPSDLILNEWVELVFNSDVGKEYFATASKQTTNLASINMTQLRSFPFPIPPRDEQEIILEKVQSLLSYCDRLEVDIMAASNTLKRFAFTSVAAITGAQTQEKEKMKAPKTDLISKLRIANSPKNKDDAPLSAILMKHDGELSAKALWSYSGMEIDDFYRQLKTEMANGWIVEPEKATMKEVETD